MAAQIVEVHHELRPERLSGFPDPKYGEPTPYDPEFRGPVHRRSCTDVLFLFAFVIFVIGWACIAFLAVQNGNIDRVINPSDSAGDLCGVGKYADKPNLFFFDLFKCKPKFEEDEWIPTARCRTPQVCVKQCPTKTFSLADHRDGLSIEDKIRAEMICLPGTDMNRTITDLTRGESPACAVYYIASVSIGGRCVPSPTTARDEFMLGGANITIHADNKTYSGNELVEKAQRKMYLILNARKYVERLIVDLSNSWHLVLIGLVLAMVFALTWIVLMRFIAGTMIWLGILGILTLLVACTTFSWAKYTSLKGVPGADAGLGFSRKISYYTGRRQTWLILGVTSSIILFILLFVIIFLRNRIKIAVALIKEAAKAIGYMPTALLFPVFPYLLQLLVFLAWAGISLLLISLPAGSPDAQTDDDLGAYFEKCIERLGGFTALNNKTCTIGDRALSSHVNYTHAYNLFGLLWVTAFIVAYGEMTLAAAVASYYWTRQKKDIPTLTVASAMWTSTRYHLGTLAFGSLIIAIVSFIRAMIEYVERKLKQYDNEITKAIICCCRCCCWCLENFLRFINRNAYIMCAVYGKNFCTSAKKSFFLLMRNVVRVVIVDKVTDFLLLASKLVVVGTVSALSYYVFSASDERLNSYVPTLNYPLFPVTLIAIGSYAIATCFFDVYNMAVDTLFLCFLEDCERHDGSREKPYFMSKELMLILKKKNVKPTDATAPKAD